jgi:hypothetical protein
MMEELGVNIKIPRDNSRQRIGKIILTLIYFAYGLLEDSHFIYIQVLGSINGDLDSLRKI